MTAFLVAALLVALAGASAWALRSRPAEPEAPPLPQADVERLEDATIFAEPVGLSTEMAVWLASGYRLHTEEWIPPVSPLTLDGETNPDLDLDSARRLLVARLCYTLNRRIADG
jgi:hypothetical protein